MRQFISLIVDYKLLKPLKIAVQKPKGVVHTAVSKEDFPDLTVEKAKSLENTATFIVFHSLTTVGSEKPPQPTAV